MRRGAAHLVAVLPGRGGPSAALRAGSGCPCRLAGAAVDVVRDVQTHGATGPTTTASG